MIQSFITLCLRYRYWVLTFFAILCILAVVTIQQVTVDAIPDIGENQQIVFTEWQGRSPKDIEEQVTYPLSSLLQGISGVRTVRGISAFGFSSISVIFEDDVEVYFSRTRILEKLSQATAILPEGVTPTLGPDATGLGQVLWYTIENTPDAKQPKSLSELRSLQDWFVAYRLRSVQGVAEIASVGGFIKEYQINVNPLLLQNYSIPFTKLLSSVRASNIDVGAEVLEQGDRELVIRGVGFLRTIEDIENVVVSVVNTVPITIKDVATVTLGPAFRRGILDKNGAEAVGGIVTMRYGENPKYVIERVKNTLNEIEKGLPEGVRIVPFYDRTEIIERTMNTVYTALQEAIIVTILVVFLFLLNARASILVSITLPFGVGISFILLHLLRIDSTIMSLAGLVIAIGTMVDMGIIMVENIYANLSTSPRYNALLDQIQSLRNSNTQKEQLQSLQKELFVERIHCIISAASSIAPALLMAGLTTIITFFPVFALQGSEGKLFTPLAYSKSLALFGALFVAIVCIPVLASFVFTGRCKAIEHNVVARSIVSIYTPILAFVLRYKHILWIIPLCIIAFGWYVFPKLGKEFMPSLNEGDILYMPTTTPDVSITQARYLLSYTDSLIASHPLVEEAIGKAGRALSPLDPAPVAMFETVIRLKDPSTWPKGTSIYDIMQELDTLVQVPGLINSWNFPIQTRIGMISTGIRTQIGIKIYGNDSKTLENLAQDVSKEIQTISGAFGVYAERLTGKPYIEFIPNRFNMARYGINTGEINTIIQTAIGGMSIGQIFEGRERYPIRVRYQPDYRNSLEALHNVLIPTSIGPIPLSQLGTIAVVDNPSMIQSENGMLRSVVLLNVKDRDLLGFVEEAKSHLEKTIALPPGYSMEWAGQYENQVRASKRLMILVPLSILINILILYIGFQSFKDSAIVLTAIPVAVSGGITLLWLLGANTSVAVWVGFIALFGIAVDDGVVMIDYIRQEMVRLKPKTIEELHNVILNAGAKRIRPMLMTTVTTLIALIPIMWATGAGSEVMKPMAIPTLGGMLVVSITVFVVPSLFAFFEERKINKEKRLLQ